MVERAETEMYLKRLKQFKSKIENLPVDANQYQNLPHNLKEMIKSIQSRFEDTPIPFLVTLHMHKLLFAILTFFYRVHQFTDHIDSFKDIKPRLAYLLATAWETFIKYEQQYKSFEPIYNQIRGKISANSNEHIFKWEKIISEFYGLKNLEGLDKRKRLNMFVQEYGWISGSNHCEEIMMNWLKMSLQRQQNEKQIFMCCKLHFEMGQQSKCSENENQQFKRYYLPIDSLSIRLHIKRTIVAFLNCQGGIIYIGMCEDASKNIKVVGIEMGNQEQQQFREFMRKHIVDHIYPKIPVEDRHRNNQYQINEYVSIDFIDIYDPTTFLNCYSEKGNRMYVVRIKVKLGNPEQLYHLINDREIPETYIREKDAVKKQTMKQLCELFMKRMQGGLSDYHSKRSVFHDNCRFIIKEKVGTKKEMV